MGGNKSPRKSGTDLVLCTSDLGGVIDIADPVTGTLIFIKLCYLKNFMSNKCTLVSLIIVQDGINVQAGKIPKINKRAGWNKAVQVGIFHFLLVKIKVLA